MRLRSSSYFLILILIVMLVIIVQSTRYERIEVKLMPIIIASSVIILGIIALWQEIAARSKVRGEDKPTSEVETKGEIRELGYTLGWIVGLFIGIYLVGFVIAIPVFIASYMKVRGRSWLVALSFAVIMEGALYGVFELGLRAELYRGLIYSLLQG